MRKYKSLVALLILGVAACGQKGPLYMPDIEKMRNEIESASGKEEQNEVTPQSSEQSGS